MPCGEFPLPSRRFRMPRSSICGHTSKSLAGADRGIRSEVGAIFGLRSHRSAMSGSGAMPLGGFAGPMPSRALVRCNDLAATSLAALFRWYSDFTRFIIPMLDKRSLLMPVRLMAEGVGFAVGAPVFICANAYVTCCFRGRPRFRFPFLGGRPTRFGWERPLAAARRFRGGSTVHPSLRSNSIAASNSVSFICFSLLMTSVRQQTWC